MREQPQSKYLAHAPGRFPPPRRFAPSLCPYAGLVANAEPPENPRHWRELLARDFQVSVKGIHSVRRRAFAHVDATCD
jgi:hypothetical protein